MISHLLLAGRVDLFPVRVRVRATQVVVDEDISH